MSCIMQSFILSSVGFTDVYMLETYLMLLEKTTLLKLAAPSP